MPTARDTPLNDKPYDNHTDTLTNDTPSTASTSRRLSSSGISVNPLHCRDVPAALFLDKNFPYYLFSNDVKPLRHLLTLHGLPVNSLSIRQCTVALLHHIMSGSCAVQNTSGDHIFPHPGCQHVSEGFQDVVEQSYSILSLVLSARTGAFDRTAWSYILEAISLPIDSSECPWLDQSS